jgi:hypothetical protein
MPDQACYPTQVPPHTLIGGPENIKLLFDEALDNRRESLARARAWEAIILDMAQTASRRAQNAASLDHFIAMGTALAGQVGVTEGQQTVSPIRTGAGDTQTQQPAGAVYPPIRNVDQSSATANGVVQSAMAQISANIAALNDVVVKLADALAPVLVNAAGGASTPSQTTAKPA